MGIYSVTVEPRGRKNMIKEILRYGDSACAEEAPLPPKPKVKFDHPVKDAIVEERYERTVFRSQRLSKFNTHRFVPALVSERLVPCWRSVDNRAEHTPAAQAQRKLEAAVIAMSARTEKSCEAAGKFK